jgi:enterochelin esterase family protein
MRLSRRRFLVGAGASFLAGHGSGCGLEGEASYHPCPEAFPSDDVPRGEIIEFLNWADSEIYAGTVRNLWIYKPQQLGVEGTPGLMVFNDGDYYLAPNGPVRAAAVFDSLVHAGDLRPTICVFVNPGKNLTGQRSFEYDNMDGAYARFLIDEIVPFVERELRVKLSDEPRHRYLCGFSSGGICAFTVAWHRADVFGRVLSHCGSFVNIRGGHQYPDLVRSTPRKPIRVVLQSGANDMNNYMGDWPRANREMAEALEAAGYESRFVFGGGGHDLGHGGAIFAQSLRWLAA